MEIGESRTDTKHTIIRGGNAIAEKRVVEYRRNGRRWKYE